MLRRQDQFRSALAGVDTFATHVLPLDEAPHAYEIFQKKRDGAVKVVLKP
jgi:threonine dehydrogenase-like Zn-dependent dehydrogenase